MTFQTVEEDYLKSGMRCAIWSDEDITFLPSYKCNATVILWDYQKKIKMVLNDPSVGNQQLIQPTE
jgi:hypothetical protein